MDTTFFPSFPELVDVIPLPIVEGVGCEEGWELERMFWQYPTDGIIHRENFISCYEDGGCIFTNEDFDNLPVITQEPDYVLSVEDGKVDYPLYDFQGRRLTGKTTKGVYIQNGKKVMVK